MVKNGDGLGHLLQCIAITTSGHIHYTSGEQKLLLPLKSGIFISPVTVATPTMFTLSKLV